MKKSSLVKMMKENNKYLHSIVVVSGLLLAGIFIGGFFIGKASIASVDQVALVNKAIPDYLVEEGVDEADFQVFWDVWKLINDKFPNADEVERQERVFSATKGLVDSLEDKYSSFFDPEEAEYFQQNISGEFSGVGMEVGTREEGIVVISPLKDSPAESAGVLPGDVVIAVDDVLVTEMTIDEVVQLIRGEIGTDVKLTVIREGEDKALEIEIVRDTIEIPTIDTYVEDDVFVIELYSFSDTSPRLFKEALQEFLDAKKQHLILDLRGNPGGFLDASQTIASWFLPEGKVIVTEDYGNDEAVNHRSKGYDIFNENLKFVVLVDGGSASASEILAGALQDHEKATIVGTKTFGKGSVQELIPIRGGGSLKITVAKWLTPNGNSISDGGLTPDVEVELTKEDIETENDAQLKKAIEVVKEL